MSMINQLSNPTLLALASVFSLAGGLAQAAEAVDHSQHMAPAKPASAADSGMDHSGMDHGAMNHSSPDHSTMDHGSMDHGQTKPAASAPTQTSRTPIPVLTDADRQAAFSPLPVHAVHDKALNSFFLFDQLEWQNADDGSALNWDAVGWIGGDINRLWLRSEGERSNGVTEEAELHVLGGHAIGPWWDLVGGVRQDFKPGSAQTWAAIGLQGMVLYGFEAEATAYLGEGGQTALRLEGDYDLLITNRLVLQPTAEANFYGKNDAQRGIGSGLADAELGLRLRYEIRREFAPYIGITWNRSYGNTADFASEEGEDNNEARLVAGVRVWF